MSPRSEEFLHEARDRLAAAAAALDAGFPPVAVSAAYYAMFYAARAALSEEDRNAKTHRGVWSLFSETFVATGLFEDALLAEARRIQRLREGGDYDARQVSKLEAAAALEHAGGFVRAIEQLLGS